MAVLAKFYATEHHRFVVDRSILTQFVGDTRLVTAEEGEIEVHGGHRRGGCQQGEVHLLSGLHLQRFNEIVAVHHEAAMSARRLMDRLRIDLAKGCTDAVRAQPGSAGCGGGI